MLNKIISLFKKNWHIFLFVFLIFAFFNPFFLKGKVPIALDIPTGMYYPWLNESFGFPVKVPVKNALLTDTISQFWIWRNWAVDGLARGEVRIWNPMSLAGYEMSPWFHTMLFSPLNIFYFLASKTTAMSLVIISQVVISLFSSFLFAKEFFGKKILATYFSLIWTFSSFFVGWLTWGTISHALASLPLILYFVVRGKNTWLIPKNIFFYFLSFCLFLLSGHPQTIAYCLFVWIIFVCVESIKSSNKKFIIKNLVILLLSLAFLSPVILPSLKIIFGSIRSTDTQLNSVNFGLVPMSKILGLSFTPNFFGNPATGNYFGGGYNFQEKLSYFGIIPLFLSIFALVNFFYSKQKSNLINYGLFFLFFGLLISTEGFFGNLIYHLNIPILSTSPAGRGLIIFIFGASILSVSGLSLLFSKNFPKKSFFVSSLILFFCYFTCFSIIWYLFDTFGNAPASLVESYQALRLNYTTLLRNLLLSFAIFIFSWSAILVFNFFNYFRSFALFVVFALTVADSYLFFKKYTPFVPSHLYFPETPSIKFLKSKLSESEIFRIERQSGEVMPPNMWEPYGLSSLSGYDPMASKAYESYLLKSNIVSNYSRYVELGQKLDDLNHLGVKYFMVIKRNDHGLIDENGDHPYYIDHSKWQEVATDGPISILENKNAKPPYKTKDPNGLVDLVSHSETNFKFKVKSPADTEFIFYQNQNNNWSAKIDGKKANISPEGGTFFNISVKKGESLLELSYKNREFVLGLQLSLISLFILIFVIFKSKV